MKNNKKKLLQVTVAIPALNEGINIKNLIMTILQQNQSTYILNEIIIASDLSTDNTVQEVKSIKNKKVKLIVGKERLGQLRRIKQMVDRAKGDVIVLLDADITLTSAQTIAYLVAPFYDSKKIGIVGGNRVPVAGKTFVEKSIQTSIRAYDNIALKLRNGNNPYNCHGQIMALSKDFAKNSIFPDEIFSGDTFLYFQCLANNFEFRFAPLAKAWIYTADNFHDAIIQYSRFLGIDERSKKLYSNLIDQEYKIPVLLKSKYLLKELISDPVHSIAMYIIKLAAKYQIDSRLFRSPTWQIAQSTKNRKFNV